MARLPSEHLAVAAKTLCDRRQAMEYGGGPEWLSLVYAERILLDVAEELRAEEARARYDDEAPRS